MRQPGKRSKTNVIRFRTQKTPHKIQIDENLYFTMETTRRSYILAVIYDNQKLHQYNIRIHIYFHVDSLLFAFVACRQCNSHRIEDGKCE